MRAAELTALIVQGLFSSASTYVYEVVFFTIAQEKWILVRLVYNGIKYATFFIPAILDDKFKSTFLRKWVADGLALTIHQVPIYIISSLFFGIDAEKIVFISIIYLVDNFSFGWVYGVVLRWAREKFITKTT